MSDTPRTDEMARDICANRYGKPMRAALILCDELERENARLRSELAEARTDAERYRWLRSSDSNWTSLFADPLKWDGGGWVRLGSRWVKERFDAAIDAARGEGQSK